MSEGQQQGPPDEQPSPMAERLRKARELADMTYAGTKSTVDSAAEAATVEATAGADAAQRAAEVLAAALGKAVSDAVEGAARSTGSVAGGMKGTASGLLLAAQIGGSATMDAARDLAGSSTRATGRMAEAVVMSFEDQATGAQMLRGAARELAQETFDAASGAAFGALGSLATATGAVAGGAKGSLAGTFQGVRKMADAGAEATWTVSQEAGKGTSEVLRRSLRRPAQDQS